MEKKPYHHKALRNTLIEEGIVLVSAEGAAGFSLRRVAAACGVSHAAPYSHFKNKEDLMDAMQRHITEQFVARLEEAVKQHETAMEQILYMGKAYVMFFLEHPHYFSFLQMYSGVRINLSAGGGAESYKPYEILRRQILSMLEPTGLSAEEKNDVVIALWANVQGVASIATMKNVVYDQPWEQKITDILRAPSKLMEARP